MSKHSLTRRCFVGLMAATAAAATIGPSVMKETALAESGNPNAGGDAKRIRTCCRGCGKMECVVWVTVSDGRVVKIEGDESSITSNGNCCPKSQSSVQAAYHPDRLRYPMKRTNPRNASDPGWVRISWNEFFELYVSKAHELRDKYGDTCLSLWRGTSRFWAASAFHTPDCTKVVNQNMLNAGEICKGPRRMVGHIMIENGAYFMSSVDQPRVYVQWGTDQTQSNYDDSCRTVAEGSYFAKHFISVDPRRSNCGTHADYHLPLRPGSDNALALAWIHVLMRDELYDDGLCKRWTNGPFLYCEEIDRTGFTTARNNQSKNFQMKTRLLKESDVIEGGSPSRFYVWDNFKEVDGKAGNDCLTYFETDEGSDHAGMWEGQDEYDFPTTGWECETGGWIPDSITCADLPTPVDPSLWGEYEITLKDGRVVTCKPVFQKWWDDVVADMTPEHAGELCDLDPQLIEDSCRVWATRIDPRIGNGGINFQLAPEQFGNATMNFRALYALTFIAGNYDIPGGNRGMTRGTIPWERVRKTAKPTPGACLSDTTGAAVAPTPKPNPNRIPPDSSNQVSNWDKLEGTVGAEEFPFLRWHTGWVDAKSILNAMLHSDPYPIKGHYVASGHFWQQCNTNFAHDALMSLDWVVAADLWHNPGTEFADLLAPVAHWLEIDGWTRQSQGAAGGMAATVKCVDPPGEAMFDPAIARAIDKYDGVPWYTDDDAPDPWDADWDYQCDCELAEFEMKWKDYVDLFQREGTLDAKKWWPEKWGTYRRYEMGYLRQPEDNYCKRGDGFQGFNTPTMKCELWSTIMETYCDPEERLSSPRFQNLTSSYVGLPTYEEPYESPISTPELFEKYPFIATTGRRSPIYFHSEHRQLPWCREQWPVPRMEMNADDAAKLGIEQGDWVWIENDRGKIRQVADLGYGVKPGVVNLEHDWWFPEIKTADKGWQLCGCNQLVDKEAQDRFSGSSQLRGYGVKIYKATPENSPFGNPCPCDSDGVPIIADASDPRLKEWLPDYEIPRGEI